MATPVESGSKPHVEPTMPEKVVRHEGANHFKSNLRDVEFNLFEVFGTDRVLGRGPFVDIDRDVAHDILHEAEKIATKELASSFTSSDRNPPIYDAKNRTVTMSEDFKKSFRAFKKSEAGLLGLPEEIKGIPCPPSLRWAAAEFTLGANPPIYMTNMGDSFAAVVYKRGTDEQKKIAYHMVDKKWGATMVLTEPEAGSDVGAAKAKAYKQKDGTWHVEGVKRFITGGEHDLVENIVHLVLARPVDPEHPELSKPGTKGLSLFLVPKYEFDMKTGKLGARNGVYATNLEKKMGIKASPTCEMRFGEEHPAKGWLLGDEHNGIDQMFDVIEGARMMVGEKAIATLSTAYQNALEFAKTREQGADLTRSGDKSAPKVKILDHPEVRRSLMLQKGYAEGMRALVLYTATHQDTVALAESEGKTRADKDVDMAHRMNDLLLPIVKGYGSEKSSEQLSQSLQIFGGSGFIQDYPMEQYMRDAKIDSLYEGTTAIQGQDFFFRKIIKDGGRAIGKLTADMKEFSESIAGGEVLAKERELLKKGIEDMGAIMASMSSWAGESLKNPKEIYKTGQNTNRLLMATGDVVVSWLLLRQADVALAKLDKASDEDRLFYQGKIAAAKFFARNVLPHLSAERQAAEMTDTFLMEVSEKSF